MKELTKITIAGQKYPVKMDINVLEEIQEKYGSVNIFEKEISGIRNIEYDEEGRVKKIDICEPSIKAIKFVLPLMINEGMKITADMENKDFSMVDAEMIYRECDVSFYELAEIAYDEFKKCFSAKKQKPSKEEKKSR